MEGGEGHKSSWRGRRKFAYETGSAMSNFRWEGKLVDVMVVCGPRTLPAHRLVLASSSPFFENLLVEDSKKSPSTTLDLEDVDGDTMETLLDYMYKGQARPSNVDTDHMINLMTTAHLLQIYVAGRYFCESLLHMRPCRNLALLWDWAEEFESLEVEQTLIDYIVKNMHMVWKYRDFGQLSLDRVTTVLSQPVLATADNQDHLLNAVIAWVKHDLENRKPKLGLLTPFISFQRLSENLVQSLMNDEPLVQTCLQLVQRFASCPQTQTPSAGGKPKKPAMTPPTTRSESPRQAVKQKGSSISTTPISSEITTARVIVAHSDPPKQSEREIIPQTLSLSSFVNKRATSKVSSKHVPQSVSFTIAPPQVSHQLLVAGRDEANRFTIQIYSFTKRVWSEREEIIVPSISQETLAYALSNIYIIGGEDQRGAKLRDVIIYNLRTKIARDGAPMRVARASAMIAHNGSVVYVVGGVSRFGKPMAHVECYNAQNNSWHILPAVKEKRVDPGLAILQDKVYLIGGDTRRCEYYDATSESWHTSAPLPEQLRQLSVFVVVECEKLYVFRAYRPDRTHCYDPMLNHWQMSKTSGRPPEVIRALASAVGEIWALDRSNHISMFNTKMNSWEMSLPPANGIIKVFHLLILEDGC
uniref:Kelch-like protein diablo n=1 Tax=Strigamia maritima TaxID=126957 RepID=T1J389_STRMM